MNVIRLIRVKQWIKNLLIFAAFIFAGQYDDPRKVIELIAAFFSFSLVASSIYVFNDLLDVEQDRQHPVKRNRPIASGAIKPPFAIVIGVLLLGGALTLSGTILPIAATGMIVGYFIMMILYSLYLKHLLLIDVFIVAIGLTARAIFGAIAIEVSISDWLLICAFLISLMLALIKRRQELARVGNDPNASRKSLRNAPPLAVWDQWITTISGVTILAYMLYTIDPITVQKIGSKGLIYSSPFVIFALFRYNGTRAYRSNWGRSDGSIATR